MELNLNNSKIQRYKNCHRLYYWQYVKNLAPKGFNEDLVFGSIIHEGIRYFMLDDLDAYDIKTTYTELLAASNSPEETERVETFYSKAKVMMEAYSAVYQSDLETYDIINIEEELSHEIAPGFVLYGTPDCFAANLDGELVLFEHKTASQISAGYLEKLALDTQVTTYCYLASKNSPLRLPDKIIYNVLRKTRAMRKNSETWEQYEQRLLDVYMQGNDFYREELHRDDTALKDFEQQTIRIFNEIQDLQNNNAPAAQYYQNTAFCSFYESCKYMPLCTIGSDAEKMYDIRKD